MGAWDLYRDNWQNYGGSFSVIEVQNTPPHSNYLYQPLGELCGNAFWIFLNQRLHLTAPKEERFVSEIEKSLYNVILAGQYGSEGARYHTMLVGKKEPALCNNSCCEGQMTRTIGALPEFIYSIAADGIYVNLYAPSSISWSQSGRDTGLEMKTRFPEGRAVELKTSLQRPTRFKLHIRTPSWAGGNMAISVNGAIAVTGAPGTYVELDRLWGDGDVIAFELPMDFRLTRYTGADQVAGRTRYALEYGPLLMAALRPIDTEMKVTLARKPEDLLKRLVPVEGKPLHFRTRLVQPETEFVPYYEINDESFSCVPLITSSPGIF